MDIMMKEISTLICMLRKAQQTLSMKIPQNASKHSIENLFLQPGFQVPAISSFSSSQHQKINSASPKLVYTENLEIVDTNLEKPNIKRRKISIELALVRSERDDSLSLL